MVVIKTIGVGTDMWIAAKAVAAVALMVGRAVYAIVLDVYLINGPYAEGLLVLLTAMSRWLIADREEERAASEIGGSLVSSETGNWQRFQEYCKRDVVAMRVIYNKLKVAFRPPPTERRLWLLDQVINERGPPISEQYVHWAQIVNSERKRGVEELNKLTGLRNANSVQQLLLPQPVRTITITTNMNPAITLKLCFIVAAPSCLR